MRRVEITVGVPEELKDSCDEGAFDELYCTNFIEESEEEGFTAHSNCLCPLQKATVAWLTGSTEEEVRAIMSDDCNHADGQHEEDKE